MTIEEQLQSHADLLGSVSRSLDRLTNTVIAHDAQIEGLIEVAEKQDKQIAALTEQITRTERQWQAYINTLPRH
jgi:uncharacterized protein (DUF3084 family)